MVSERCDLLVHGGLVVALDERRRVLRDGAVAARDGRIVAVGPAGELRARFPEPGEALDATGHVVTPGLVNAHLHLTGPSLFPGLEPGDSPVADHFPRWVLPPHVHSEPEDERAAARLVALMALRQGTTAILEAGVVRHPEAVLDGLDGLGPRVTLGAWAADAWPLPPELAATTEQAIGAIERALALAPPSDRLRVWPNLIGHTGCSDELLRGAAALAREHDAGWTLHMSAMADDGEAYRQRTGRDPLVHLAELGVLDERVTVAHGIHLSAAEVDALRATGATVCFCPGAALRLATGVTRAGRHPDLPHVALGTDTQNASNHLDLLRAAAAAVDLYGEVTGDRARLTAERALEWIVHGGARALRTEPGLAPGRPADLVVWDPGQPVGNVANALVHGSPRAVHVAVAGEVVLRDGRRPGEEAILREAEAAAERVAARAGLPLTTGWLAGAAA